MFALILALTVATWAQTSTQTTPQQSTVPADKAKCGCCDKMAAADAKDAPACCAHHDMKSEAKDKDGKETASCCAGKDAKADGKDAMSCMKNDKDKAAAACCKDDCSKDKAAAACCGEKCGKDGEKSCCSTKKTEKTAKNCCAKELHS